MGRLGVSAHVRGTKSCRGQWTFGGDEPGTGGQIGTDEYTDTISESDFKKHSYGENERKVI
jgi:hypothetical protein